LGGIDSSRARLAFLKQTSLQDPNSFQTTVEVFEQGLQTAGKDAKCLGYRPKVSDEPLKFADHFVWQTYGEVDTRRKNLGSAIQGLFNSGDALAAEGLETVALWSMNIPGEYTTSLPFSCRWLCGCEGGF
jgi:long-chain acyl-CoA synthetase